MLKKRMFSPIIALTALLLVGCSGRPITRDEAMALASRIEECYSSDEFEFPNRYTMSYEDRYTNEEELRVLSSLQILDESAKYLYCKKDYPLGDTSELWIYYQKSDNKTYYVANENGTKFYSAISGDQFIDALNSTIHYEIEDFYSSLRLLQTISYTTEDETRNVYTSKGEGNLSFSVFYVYGEKNISSEIEIDSYLIIKSKSYIDENNFSLVTFDYGRITMEKPDIADYYHMT